MAAAARWQRSPQIWLQWCRCPHRYGAIAHGILALSGCPPLPATQWSYCPCCAGVVQLPAGVIITKGLNAMPVLGRHLGGPSCRLRGPRCLRLPRLGVGLDLRPPVAFFFCFFLASVAAATVPAAPSFPVPLQRIQRGGLMPKGVVGTIVLFTCYGLVMEASG